MNEFKVNTLLSDYKFPDYKLDCYNYPIEGGLFCRKGYNLNNFSDRHITKIKDGFIEISNFGSGWFKIEDINKDLVITLEEFPEIEELLNESKKITNT